MRIGLAALPENVAYAPRIRGLPESTTILPPEKLTSSGFSAVPEYPLVVAVSVAIVTVSPSAAPAARASATQRPGMFFE